jgi:hypothetical protein
MATAYDVQYPKDMTRLAQNDPANWAESAIHLVVDSVEECARTKPLSFALWTFGIGFVLGWKLKPW